MVFEELTSKRMAGRSTEFEGPGVRELTKLDKHCLSTNKGGRDAYVQST
jgi:hypothetical protein